MTRSIRVLLVDSAPVTRDLLGAILGGDPEIQLVGSVADGQAALDFLAHRKADIAVVDVQIDGMDGYEVTRRIMETSPLPIVLCSATADPGEVATAFRAIEAGAVAVVAKPKAMEHPDFKTTAAELRKMVRLMAEVKVVRRWPRKKATAGRTGPAPRGMVGIGASTGGPPALQAILAALSKDFPLPILIVQHISRGFLPGLADWLAQTTALQVQIAANGIEPRPGHVYLAPDDFHMEIDARGYVRLTREPAENGLRPSVDRLFHSLSVHRGQQAVGVLLTGMGKDGARQLKAMSDAGAQTIVQDRETSVIHGMPGAAIALGAAREVLPLDQIADALLHAANQRKGEPSK